MTSIRCAHCKDTHASVSEVRACASRSHDADVSPTAALMPQRTPWKAGDPLPFPPGRYAILDPAEDPVAYSYVDRQDLVPPREESVRFFKIDAPDEGRWSGYVFVSRQASDDLYPIKDRRDKEQVINRILDDGWKQCLLLYGQKIGKCGHCGRTLTNDESRAYGIGPVCRRDPKFAMFA